MKRFISHSPKETEAFGRRVASFLKQVPLPYVVFVKGPLGAGKTTLIKTVLSELAVVASECISSPTFQYVALYPEKDGKLFAHFDLWRLPGVDTFLEMGLDEIFASAFSFVEWPERLDQFRPERTVELSIEAVGEEERHFWYPSEWGDL